MYVFIITFCVFISFYWSFAFFTLYTLTSVKVFSILFPINSLRRWQGEFVEQFTASLLLIIFSILITLLHDSGVIL